jgi:hydroxyacylglutathione hydrolase
MYIEQLYTNCLSEAAYYIESNGEAAIIDPLRDTDAYIVKAKERNAKIVYIFETHFHADFVSGHLDLSAKTNAPIIYGPDAITSFKKVNATHGQVFPLGDISITALHTPGHTLESTCYLLKNNYGTDHCIFTGDTLFVGDVGRPDLFGGIHTKEELASMLYHSLQKNILPLADGVIMYPAHGPGSSCGKNLGPETFSTIGEQKKNNYALQAQTEEEFVTKVTDGLQAPPAYFSMNAKLNQHGYDSLDIVMEQSKQALNAEMFALEIKKDVIILDTRPATVFTQGFITGSIFIGLEARFAEWAATMLPSNQAILLVCEQGKEEETIIRLSRVGYDNVIGYLEGGIEAWQQAGHKLDLIIDVEPDELAMEVKFDENIIVMDVRKENEFDAGHVKDAQNKPLHTFNDPLTMAFIEETDNVYVHCAGGYRSVIACSILKKHGFHNIRNVVGGWTQIKLQEDLPFAKSAVSAK